MITRVSLDMDGYGRTSADQSGWLYDK